MKKLLFTLYSVVSFVVAMTAQDLTPKLDAILARYDLRDKPGLSVGVFKNGKPIYKQGFGLANLDYGIKNSDSTAFSVASIAKQFTAACVWKLVENGQLSLDDDIRKHLPEFPDYGHEIKIRHLLNHTSGIRNYHTLMHLSGFDYDTEYYDNQTLLELAIKQKSLNNIPGQKMIYSNTPYNLLAIIIERISGKNLHEFASENFFRPLEMKNTLICTENNSVIKNCAIGYVENDNKSYSQFPRIQRSYGAGSMVSTVNDLAKWSEILYRGKPELAALSDFLATSEKLQSGKLSDYARGVMVDSYKGFKTVHHSGSGLGGHSQLLVVPELQLSIMLLSNLDHINPTPISYQILDLFLPEPQQEKVRNRKKYVVKSNDISQFAGHYKEIDSDMKMEIILENDTLKSKGIQSKQAAALKAYDKNKFYRQNNESVKYEFNREKDAMYDLAIFFGGTPFYFKRAVFVKPEDVAIQDYIGSYFSEELNIAYSVFQEDQQLYLSYRNHPKIRLFAGQRDEFGANDRVLYHFERDQLGKVDRLLVSSDGSVQNIKFVRN